MAGSVRSPYEAVASIIACDSISNGEEVLLLEAEFAEYLNVSSDEVVATNSGTAALTVALIASGVKPGDEVIVPAFGFSAATLAVLAAGATPVLADVCRGTRTLRAESVNEMFTASTTAVIAIDTDGAIADFDALRAVTERLNLLLIEDAAPAIGSYHDGYHAGTFGDVGTFSLNWTKILSAGEGGFCVFKDKRAAKDARAVIRYGESNVWAERRAATFPIAGNYKMPALSAAFCRSNLTRLEVDAIDGRVAGHVLDNGLKDCAFMSPPKRAMSTVPCWHKYRAHLKEGVTRADAERMLARRGVPHTTAEMLPIRMHPAFEKLVVQGHCPNADAVIPTSVVLGDRARPVRKWSVLEVESYVSRLTEEVAA